MSAAEGEMTGALPILAAYVCAEGEETSRMQVCGKGGNVIMTRDNPKYSAYISILKEELIPAMGCTEPIALAYCAAKAREVLGANQTPKYPVIELPFV